jgi:hypothetical protein
VSFFDLLTTEGRANEARDLGTQAGGAAAAQALAAFRAEEARLRGEATRAVAGLGLVVVAAAAAWWLVQRR